MDIPSFSSIKTIAIIGLSPEPTKISHVVASYMKQHGYHIIPVNPNATNILDETCYPSLSAIPNTIHIDVVDIFRKPEFVTDIVREALKRKEKPLIWMQEGVVAQEAQQLAKSQGLPVVMDRCIMKEHNKFILS